MATEHIEIQFTLFSAFYAPLIATIAGDFLKNEGLTASWSVASPGVSAIKAIESGKADVIQSAPSQGFSTLTKGETPVAVHFAQINEMDGFFLTAREPDPDFSWKKLEGSEVLLFGGGQPLVMFKYACHQAGIDFAKVKPVHVGGAADMDKAFREGKAAYVQQQGPFPQQLEADGVGHVVAEVGLQIGACAFSSLAARRAWLESAQASAFMRAYSKARAYMNETAAADIATLLTPYFPDIDTAVLAKCLASYQQLGCWTPHVEITRDAYEVTLDIFQYAGGLQQRYAYEQVCAAPPTIGA